MIEDKDAPRVYLIGDHYIAQLKGAMIQLSPNIEIIDICNTVQAFSTLQAGYVLRTAYPFFPKGTIHFIGINSEPSATNKIFLVKHEGHYFVGADNGIYSLIFEDNEPESVYELVPELMYRFIPKLNPAHFFDSTLEFGNPKQFSGFSAIKIITTVIHHIMSNMDISLLGKPAKINREKKTLKATYTANSISGSVIFIDHFGNLITNITRELFDEVGKQHPFNITIRSSLKFSIDKISTDYNVIGGEKQYYLALFNSFGVLEIAQKNDSLAQLESIDTLSGVEIEFFNRLF
ncbi:MAG: SAM-dependent chlorinase/fluorinase [Prevotellaceae bacterium]|nr:SAM-dependent chlorinase/fluorinase [Prevotellaceae bacterium]